MLISLLLAIIVLTLASFAKVLDDKKRQRFLDILSQASKQRSEEENAFIDNTVNDVLNGLNINLSKDKVNNIKQIFRENNINSLTKNPKVQKKISSIRAELNEKNNTASNYRNSIPYEPDPHGYNKAIYTEDDAFEVDEDENFVYPPFKSVDHEISNADDELFGYSFDDKDALNVDEVKTGDGNDAYTCKAKDDDIIVKNCLHFNDEQRIILNKNTNIEKIDLLKDAFLMWPKDNKVKKLFLDGLKIVENAKNIKNIGFKRKNGQNSILAIDDNNITGTFRSFSGEITLDATNNRRMNVNCIYDNTDDDGRTIECVLDVEGGEQRCPMFGEILIDKKNYIIGENNPVDEITVFGSSVSFLSCPDNNGTARVKIGNFPEEAEEKEEEVEVENSDEETESDVFLKKETDIEIDVEGIANCNTLKIEIDKKTNEIINIYASAKQEGEENKEMVDEPEKAIFKINNDVSFKNTDEDALKVNIKGIALKKYYRESLEGGGFYYHIESADGMGNKTQESCFIESDKIQLNAAYDNGRVFEAMDIYDDKITLFPKNGKIEELYNNGLKIINKGENIYSITISRKTGRIIDVKGKSASRGEDFTPLKGAYMIGDTAVYVDGCNIGRLRQKDSYSGNKGNGNAIEIESANMLTINDDGTRSFAFDALNRGIVVTKYRGDLSDRRGKIGIINSTTRMFEDNNDTVNFIKLCDFHKKGLRRIQIGVDKKAKTVSVEGAVECPPEEQKSEEDIGDYSLLPNDIQTINDACVVERKQPIVDNRSLIEFPPPEEKLNEEKKEEEKKEEEKKEAP